MSVKRNNLLCLDCQIAFDISKLCCGNLCLLKFGKTNLRGLQHKYLSVNGLSILDQSTLKLDISLGIVMQ